MSRRLEIELTSERPDGTWTWRKAGAKEPKGEMSASVLPSGSKVGDVLRAEAEFLLDGIEITSIIPAKAARKAPELLQVLGTGRSEPGVTTQLVERKGRGDRGDRRDRGERGERRGDRRESRDGRREGGDRRPRGPRPDPIPERPKPKRLRPGRTNRNAVLDEVAPEMRPIAEQVLKGGVPAVREAVAEQNKAAKAENRPEAPVDQVVALAEAMLPALRAAEWKDRAEAALADLDQLDLRDLRSVVVAADNVTRDDELKAMREQLQQGLNRRVEEEHEIWVSDIEANLGAGRFVRALRLSSRPPKAGTPVPAELGERLVAAVSTGLTAGTNQELWAAAVDALAYAPVRGQVVPAGVPEKPTDDLLDAVRRVADRVPKVAALFGIDPSEAAGAKRRPRPNRQRPGAKKETAGRRGDGQKRDGRVTESSGTTEGEASPATTAEVADPPVEPPAEAATEIDAETDRADAEIHQADAEIHQADAVSVDAGSPEAWEAPGADAAADTAAVEPGPDASDGPGGDPGPAAPVGASDETPTAAAMDLADAVSDDIGDTQSAVVPEGEATPSSSSTE